MTPLLLSLLVLLAKSLAVLALAGLVLLALRRASAASRHLVCLLTLYALLALPLFSQSRFSLPVTVPTALPHAPADLTPRPLLPQGEGAGLGQETGTHGAQAEPQTKAGGQGQAAAPTPALATYSPTPPELGAGGPSLLALWLFGVIAASVRPLLGLWGIGQLNKRSRPEASLAVLALTADCVAALGLSRPPAVRRGDVPVPMTWGLRRPVVLLPGAADTWPEGRMQAVLLHELAHIRRRDWAAHRLADLACALYWFHPLVWLTARRLRAEGEIACDDLVLSSGVSAPDYARHLLDIARALSPAAAVPAGTVAMARTAHVEGRIAMILKPTQNRRALTRRAVLLAFLPATAALGAIALLRPAARAESTPSVSTATDQQHETASKSKHTSNPIRSPLLIKYFGLQGYQLHKDDVRPAQKRPVPGAALYGKWAETYSGIKSGNSEKFLLRAQKLEPNNPQWADRLGVLYQCLSINTPPETTLRLDQKALAQYELAVRLLDAGPGTSSDMAVAAFDAGEYQKARTYANDLLERSKGVTEWNLADGEEFYHAHLVLGLLALHDGNTADAEAHLLTMGRLFSSPIRYENGFGPSMSLARNLLLAGHRDAVLTYLDECGKVWKRPELAVWRSEVQQGKTPDFGPNLYY